MTYKSLVPGGVSEANEFLAPPTFMPGQPYNPRLADEAVKFSRLCFDRRFWQLLWVVIGFWLSTLGDWFFPKTNQSRAEYRRTRACRLKDVLVHLGPTFIKVGQFLSVRRDLLPLEVAEELSLLQDKVPSFAIDLVRQTIISDLGQDPEALFAFFEKTPLASASIGQVHRLRFHDGSWAVAKVQRADLSQIFYRDLGYLRLWIRIGRFLGLGQRAQSWLLLSDEFGRTLFSEIDFIEEGRNADKLRKILRGRPQIKVPRVYWKHTGRRVLTLEYLPGIKIDHVSQLQAQGLDLKELGNLLIECYLEQIVFHGFFHADPHAGNLAVDEAGNLIIYDFGMMGTVTQAQRRALAGCITAVVERNALKVANYLIDLGVVRQDARLEPIVRTLQPFIDYYGGKDILELDFRHLERDIDKVVEDQALRLPPTLAYLLRAGSALEGIARTLKPNFSFVTATRPLIKKWAIEQGISNTGKVVRVFQALSKNRLSTPESAYAMSPKLHTQLAGKNNLDPQMKDEVRELRIRLLNAERITNTSLLLASVSYLSVIMAIGAEYQHFWALTVLGNGLLIAILLIQFLLQKRSTRKNR